MLQTLTINMGRYFIAFCLFMMFVPSNSLAQFGLGKKEQPRKFVREVNHNLRLDGVRANAATQNNGIQGILFELDLMMNGETSMAGKKFELYLLFEDANGEAIQVSRAESVYAGDNDVLALSKSFSVSQFVPIWDQKGGVVRKITDHDTKEAVTVSGKDAFYPLATFMPYYAMQLPAKNSKVNVRFFYREDRFNFRDTVAVNTYHYFEGIQEHELVTNKPAVRSMKVGIDEIEAMKLDKNGQKWDVLDFQNDGTEAPDIQWSVSLQTTYKNDPIFTSAASENTYFNKWHHAYSPRFIVSESDKVTFEVVDVDYIKSPDVMGSWAGTFQEMLGAALDRKELGFGKVKRMLLNVPRSDLKFRVAEVRVDTSKRWDVYSVMYDVEAPDLYVTLTDDANLQLAKSKIVENSYQASWEDVRVQLEPKLGASVLVKVMDDDLIDDDLVGVVEVPLSILLNGNQQEYVFRGEGVEVVVRME